MEAEVRIVGPDELIFGVDNVDASKQFLRDYGLSESDGGRFEALDGTALTVRAKGDADLPAPLPTATMLRQTVWGVEDEAALAEIEAELSKDREVTRDAKGRVCCKDDLNFSGHDTQDIEAACRDDQFSRRGTGSCAQ